MVISGSFFDNPVFMYLLIGLYSLMSSLRCDWLTLKVVPKTFLREGQEFVEFIKYLRAVVKKLQKKRE